MTLMAQMDCCTMLVFVNDIGALPHIKCACLLPLDGIYVLNCSTEKNS